MKTELQAIIDIITNYTAVSYAEMMLKQERESCVLATMNVGTGEMKETKTDYYEYMKQVWHWEENPSLEECIEQSRISKMNQYAKAVKIYTGWVKNGRVFILNKAEKFVSFLYKVKKENGTLNAKPVTAVLYTHYNPLDVDCIEESVNHKHLFDGILSEKYDISLDEEKIIEECDLLISAT